MRVWNYLVGRKNKIFSMLGTQKKLALAKKNTVGLKFITMTKELGREKYQLPKGRKICNEACNRAMGEG